MELSVKAKVECVDGAGGKATHVIVHPVTKKVTRVVVQEAQSPHTERVVPFKFVEDATADLVRLKCSREELSKMQSFLRTEVVTTGPSGYGEPLPGAGLTYSSPQFRKVKRRNIPEGESVVDAEIGVKVRDGRAGRVSKLMVDPANGAITHLLLRRGHAWTSKQVAVPISEVDRIGQKAIHLKIDRAGLEALPVVSGQRK